MTSWPADVLPTSKDTNGNLTAIAQMYTDWRPSVITSFTAKLKSRLDIVDTIKQSKGQPKVIVSASVFNEPVNSKTFNAQDWLTWIDEESVDQVHPMNYTSSYPVFTDWPQRQTAAIDFISPGFPFYPGLVITEADFTMRSDAAIDQIVATRGDTSGTVTQRRPAGGFTLYNFGGNFVNSDSLSSFKKGVTSNQTATVADISISATVNSPQQIVAGTPFNYTLTINNAGLATKATITLPAELSAQTISISSGSCTNAAGSIQCSLGTSATSGRVSLSLVSSVSITYQVDASTRSTSTDPNSANNIISKKIAVNSNIALNKTVYASSVEENDTSLSEAKAVDGDIYSRWSSDWEGSQLNSWKDNQHITIDLGNASNISRVNLNWETAYGKEYMIQVSSDNINWTTVYSTITGHAGINDIP